MSAGRRGAYGWLLVPLLAASGCSTLFGPEGVWPSRAMDYRSAKESPALTLPSGISSVPRVQLYPVPPAVPTPEPYAPVDEDDIPRPTGLLSFNAEAGVEVRDEDGLRWLQVRKARDTVYAAVRNFVDNNGFRIEREDAAAGVIETGWLRPRESERPGIFKRLFTLNFRDEYDRFRFRLEPLANGQVKVAIDQWHIEVFDEDDLPSSPDWSDEDTEDTLTDVLANDLSDFIAEEQANSLKTGVLAAAYANAPRTIMTHDGNGFPVLVITLDMNRAWLEIGKALARAEIEVEDLDRTLGIYFLERPEKFRVESSDDDDEDESAAMASEQYQVKVLRADEGVHVAVQLDDVTLAPVAEAEPILERIREHIE